LASDAKKTFSETTEIVAERTDSLLSDDEKLKKITKENLNKIEEDAD
jgi:hypothetical protein